MIIIKKHLSKQEIKLAPEETVDILRLLFFRQRNPKKVFILELMLGLDQSKTLKKSMASLIHEEYESKRGSKGLGYLEEISVDTYIGHICRDFQKYLEEKDPNGSFFTKVTRNNLKEEVRRYLQRIENNEDKESRISYIIDNT